MDSVNKTDLQEWACLSQLGSGGFGIVHVWQNIKSGEKYALKKCKFGSEITLTARHKEAWVREVDIMLRLSHPGVVACIRTPAGLDQGSSELPTLCMEYCEAGDLRQELNRLESCRGLRQSQVLEILNDVVSALGYLHNRRIIHRDLKPENIVMKSTEVRTVYKLIDLGYAKELGVSSMARSFVGTLQYVAPELFLEHDYTKSVDYWSLGLLAHEIVTGQRPFLPNMSPGHWIDHVESKKYDDISVVQDISGDIRYLTTLCPETRVCPPLSRMMEDWLRSLLDWRPGTRGRDTGDNVVVFSKLNNILTQQWISVFSIASVNIMYFSVQQCPTIQSLRPILAKLLGVSPENLLILSSHGSVISDDMKTVEIIEKLSSNTSNKPQLYLYSTVSNSVGKMINIPDLVKVALTDTKKSLSDYHQKKMFIQGYHFINEHHELVSCLMSSVAILANFLVTKLKSAKEELSKLVPSMNIMEAKHEMFKECFQVSNGF